MEKLIDPIIEDIIKKLPKLQQVQYSTNKQIDYLKRIAVKIGLYDAVILLDKNN
jgi:hypothetical protein